MVAHTCHHTDILVILFGKEEICHFPFTLKPLKHIKIQARHQFYPGACCIVYSINLLNKELCIRYGKVHEQGYTSISCQK